MFGSVLAAIAAQQPAIPLGRAQQVDRSVALIEVAGRAFASQCKDWDDYNKPAPPVQIFGNTYLVGTCGISSILIIDPAGDILIDGGTEQGAVLIADNIRTLGFRLTDIKYILHSHEHFDHVGGIGALERLTGAQLIASPAAAKALSSGMPSNDDPQAASKKAFPVAHVNRIITDGEQVRLGNTVLTAVATPGHTPGALTWRWDSCRGGVCRHVVYSSGLGPVSSKGYRFSDHPSYLAAYRASIARVAALPCDILLTPHPAESDMISRLAGRRPLVDPKACRDYAASVVKQLNDRLSKEAAVH